MAEYAHQKIGLRKREKWADAVGDRTVLSAKSGRDSGKYLGDLNDEMSEEIRVKPKAENKQLKSVRPSCCSGKESLADLSGEMDFSTGKVEVGYDKKKKQMVFGFVRHENDSVGKEVLENKARSRRVEGKEPFQSNDPSFTDGAVSFRCDAAKAPKKIRRQFGQMSQGDGGTTVDRVLPFQRQERERKKLRSLKKLQAVNPTARTGIATAISGVRNLMGKKQQKNMEFGQKFSRMVKKAKENTKTDDYLLWCKKKWERLIELHLEETGEEHPIDFTPDLSVEDNKNTIISR